MQKASQREGILTIPDAAAEDSGFYICKVVDNSGNTGDITVRVDIVQSMWVIILLHLFMPIFKKIFGIVYIIYTIPKYDISKDTS